MDKAKPAGRVSWCTVQLTGGDEVVGRHEVWTTCFCRVVRAWADGVRQGAAVLPLEPGDRCACLGVQLTSTALVQIVVTVVFSKVKLLEKALKMMTRELKPQRHDHRYLPQLLRNER